jgi:hypothetical protein
MRVRRLVAGIVAGLGWPLLQMARGVSWLLDGFLRARGARTVIPGWRYVLWALAGLLPLAAFLALSAAAIGHPPFADPGYLLLIGAAVQIFAVYAAYIIVHDDFDVMDGIVDVEARRIGGFRNATRPVAIAVSVVLVAAYAVAIAWWLAEVEGVALVVNRPHTGSPLVDYALIALRALPTDPLLGLIDRLTGDDTAVVFGGALVAQAYYFAVKAIGSILLVGVVAIAIQEAWQLRRVVTEIGESDMRHDYLIQRALLAPPVIKAGILRAAVTPQAVEKQKRLIIAAKEIGIFALPPAFCQSVESFDSEVQVFGLDQCLEMFRHRARDFDAEQSARTLTKAAHVLRRAKLGIEPTKKLLRLMTAIVVLKRGVFVVSDKVRGMMEATIRAELDKPRAKEDPALRGFFRDLQSALNGASGGARAAPLPEKGEVSRVRPREMPPVERAAKVANLPVVRAEEDPMPAPPEVEDPDAPRESPAPTVH